MATHFHRLVAVAKWRRVAKWIVVTIATLVVVAIFLIQTDPVQQFLLRKAEDFARSAGVPFTAKHVRLNLFRLQLSMAGFLYDNSGVRVEIDDFTVDVPWNIYRADGIVVNSLVADGLHVRITSTEPVVPKPSAEPSGKISTLPHIVAHRLSIRNASFSYVNQSTDVEIPSIALDATNGFGTLRLSSPITMAPDTSVRILDVPLALSSTSLRFGPTTWSVRYGSRNGGGLADGTFQWSPSIGANLNFSTDPFAIEKWNGLVARGKVNYEDGVLNIEDFRATRGNGELTGSARLSDQLNTAQIRWKNVRIDPSGIRGETGGQFNLHWKASDFTDVTGSGSLAINAPDYGRADGNVRITEGKARLNVRATAMEADIRAGIDTGWNRRLSGSFRVIHSQYGLVTAEGRVGGTWTAPSADAHINADGMMYKGYGPLNASADASYRGDVVVLSGLQAKLKGSTIPEGSLHVNVRTRSIEGTIPAINVELGDFIEGAKGEIQSTAQVSGVIDRPAVSLEASSQGLDVGDTHIDSVDASAALDGNVVDLTRLVARQREGTLEASGSVNLDNEQTQGTVHVSKLQITEVPNLSGTVNLDADISGSYRAPSANLKGEIAGVTYDGQDHGSIAINGTAETEALNLHLQSSKYNADVDGVLSLKAPYNFSATVAANRSEIRYQQYDFVANGRVGAAGSLQPVAVDSLQLDDFTVAGEGVDLKSGGSLEKGVKVDLKADLAKLPVEGVQLSGEAVIDALVHGPLDNLRVDGQIRSTNATVQAMQMPEAAMVEADVDFNQDRFVIRDVHADYADARITIGGNGTLKGAGEFTFEAENIRPERFLPDRPLSGIVGVTGRVKVNAPQLDGIEGEATIKQLQLNARDVEIHQVQMGEITLANQVATIRNFTLEGAETRASASGTVNLKTGDLSVDVLANTDLRILEGFIPRSSAFGKIESQVTVRGTTAQPDMKGFVNLTDAQIQIDEPALLLSGVNAKVQLSGDRVQIQQAAGDLNGGSVNLTGETGLSSGGLDNAAVQVMLMGTQLEYPKGLQSEISADLALKGSSPALTLSGAVKIEDAIYKEDIDLRQEVFQRLAPRSMDFGASSEAPGLMQQVSLDITVDTTGPVTVANNLAKVDLTGSFRVRGTANDPIILGRASTLEGGEVYFGPLQGSESAAIGERRDRYIIERGTVDFNNPLRTEPTFDIEATHDLQVKDERYAVTLRATGTPSDLRTELTSDPYLSETDIITMLLTGRTFTELQGAQVAVAREQLLDYASGQLTSRFFRGAGTALGLDTVTIEPSTLAAESDISARLTVGKDISRNLSLVYSQNLSGPQDQSWILNYNTLKDFVLRGINRPDQDEIRVELRHGLEFGGGPPLPRRVTPRSEVKLNAVNFSGSNFPTMDLMKRVAKPGTPYGVSRMNDDVRSLKQFLASNGYADARIRARREVSEGAVNASFTIEQGPKVTFEYHGFDLPEDARKQVLQIWVDGRSEASSVRSSIEYVLRYLRDKGYLQAHVSAENEAQNPDERLYVFQIDTGMKFESPKWVFQGSEPLEISDSPGTVLQNPEAIRDRIQYQLRSKGFLDAKSTVPELIIANGEAHFAVSVDRGQPYMVSGIGYMGNNVFTADHLNLVVILGPTKIIAVDEPGAARPPEAEKQLLGAFDSDWVSTARRRLMTEYWQQGFNDVQIGATTDYVPGSGKILVNFDIKEGQHQEISDIRIMGDEKTLRSHVLRYFKFSAGDPVDYTRINLTRKKLYDTGLFKRVDFQVMDEPQGYVAELHLNERAPWSLHYGLAVIDHKESQGHQQNLGVSTDVTYRNLLGTGIKLGASGKYDPTLGDARVFGAFPVFLDKDVATTATLFRTRETLTDSVVNTWGWTIQQQWRLRDFYLLSYDYSYRHVSNFERDLTVNNPNILEGVFPVGRFNTTLSRDTRDDIFNATRGTFLSNSFDFAPPGIGLSVKYIKNYVQYFRFRQIRPNLIYASAYKVGVAHGIGGSSLLPIDQFTAAGAIRALDPDDPAMQPGNALLLTNQELRYPLFWKFGVVGFFDVGNVYERIGAAKPLQLRYSPGIGLRLNTPFILLRVDLGFNLWPHIGEQHQRISFGIGQAF